MIGKICKIAKEEGYLTFLKKAEKLLLLNFVRMKRRYYTGFMRLWLKNDYILREIQGSKMYLDLKDRGISEDLIIDRIREPLSTIELKKRIKKGMAVVDIGANIGYYALMEASIVGNNGKIYAFEPISDNVKLLKRNVKLNNYHNIKIFQKAIGDKNAKSRIFVSSSSNLHSMFQTENAHTSIKIQLITLDSFLKNRRKPNVVRMDVEGYEFNVLKGMTKFISDKNNLELFIEVHSNIMGREETLKMLRFLKKHGFRKGTVILDRPEILRKISPFVSKDVIPPSQIKKMSIDEIMKDDFLLSRVFHLFTAKELN